MTRYLLFTSGGHECRNALEKLASLSIEVRVVRQEDPDGTFPTLVGPAGSFYGEPEIDQFANELVMNGDQDR